MRTMRSLMVCLAFWAPCSVGGGGWSAPIAPLQPAVILGLPVPAASAAFPDTVGFSIHFTSAPASEWQLIRDSGVRWVRVDLTWRATEHPAGSYNFSAYDGLLASLAANQLRAVLILDYGHPLYDKGAAPTSDAAIAAFTSWAVAAVTHFQGKGVLWELWNEPAGTGYPRSEAYAKLAIAVGSAIRSAAPQEQFIGPATAGVDTGYAFQVILAGMKYWTAVSIHPYVIPPEVADKAYPAIKAQIAHVVKAKIAPTASLPLYSSEWGYSTVGDVADEATQAKYLQRSWLINAANGIGLSIWYDWKDDGADPKNKEHHFGVVHQNLSLKPAYTAAKTLTSKLEGYSFSKRVASSSSNDYLLGFDPVSGSGATKYVAWTTGAPHSVSMPAPSGRFHQTSYLGEALPDLAAGVTGLNVQLTDAPVYLEAAK